MTDTPTPKGTPQLIAGVVVFLATLAAFVYLTAMGKDTTTLVTLCGPTVAGLLVIGHQARTTAAQNAHLEQQTEQLQTITRQTNGVLDGRIKSGAKAAVTEALQEAGIIGPAGAVTLSLDRAAPPVLLTPSQEADLAAPAEDARPTGRRH